MCVLARWAVVRGLVRPMEPWLERRVERGRSEVERRRRKEERVQNWLEEGRKGQMDDVD